MEVVIIYNMNITIKPFLYQLSNKGYMAWEYNPFHNFRITDTKTTNNNKILIYNIKNQFNISINTLKFKLVRASNQIVYDLNFHTKEDLKCQSMSDTSQMHIIESVPCMKYTYCYLDDTGNINEQIYITEEVFFSMNTCQYSFPNRYIFNSDSYIRLDASQVEPTNVNSISDLYNCKFNINKQYKVDSNILYTQIDSEESSNVEAGSIVDLDTPLLNFDLEHPVTMDIQPSYDGTVNVIFNDNKNVPRLINSRFSTTELNTYELVDRVGDNDTNIYDQDSFDLDSSLYKRINSIPTVKFIGVNSSGQLKVGNYNFYFKYSDADGNETDFVADSGVVAIFKGNDCDPFSIDGGISDENAFKAVSFQLNNIDYSYNYITVYYTRNTGDSYQTRSTKAYKINDKYIVKHQICTINVTGLEDSTEIPISEINNQFFQVNKAKTSAQCQNRLFLGNVAKPDTPYKDLTDISLRMLPILNSVDSKNTIGQVEYNYVDDSSLINSYEYYNTKNIYYNVGYWDNEIYRLGVVYIMSDNSLSEVFNIRGGNNIKNITDYTINNSEINPEALYSDSGDRQYITIDEDTNCIHGGKPLENSKGVVRFMKNTDNNEYINYIQVLVPTVILKYLKDTYDIKGLFFVRQKRNPTLLAQAFTMSYDAEAQCPAIYCRGTNYIESFLTQRPVQTTNKKGINGLINRYLEVKQAGRLIHDYDKHLCILKNTKSDSDVVTAICPEFMINQSRYNSLFTGTDYVIESIGKYGGLEWQDNNHRMYNAIGGKTINYKGKAKIISVTDDTPSVAIDNTIFRSKLGDAEEAYQFRYIEANNRSKSDAYNLVRGIYSPYLGIVSKGNISYNSIINIYIPGYSESQMNNYFAIRYDDNTAYYSIGDRIDINTAIHDWKYLDNNKSYQYTTLARGDCYLCTFTHRLNRNFADSSNPYNDEILDENTWKNNYDANDSEKLQRINRGDVNAVQLGSWITFKLKSSTNLSIRSIDESNINEKGIFGRPRAWYPYQQDLISGNNKIPESYLYNDGLRSTLNEKYYFNVPEVPYIKNIYQNRIIYSDISINDAYRNGYRVFKSTNYVDYTKEYGSIIKLVPMGSSLICVFEHGVVLLPVNERIQTGEGDGGAIFINTKNVLPENPQIVLSDMIGSQWAESVVKTPYAVYGVDTVAKKIWRTDGKNLETISDFKVNKFLVDNLSLSERETTPIIGIRNVKTHYNANKNDVMFTFYDQKYGFEDKAWNLCYNEITKSFITFYSWLPSYSANIDNIFFTFDRSVSKYIAKLGLNDMMSNSKSGLVVSANILPVNSLGKNMNVIMSIKGIYDRYIPENIGQTKVTLEILPGLNHSEKYVQFQYFTQEGDSVVSKSSMVLPNINIDSSGNIEDGKAYIEVKISDILAEWDKRQSEEEKNNVAIDKREYLVPQDISQAGLSSYYKIYKILNNKLLAINIRTTLGTEESGSTSTFNKTTLINSGYYDFTLYFTFSEFFYNKQDTEVTKKLPAFLTNFWKHGQAGIIDTQEHIKPCYWYNKQHPFEFEFVVKDNSVKQKIWDNLQIISNKAEPESFHFEINGDSYEFSKDKPNMWYRQELTKNTYQKLGSDITYDHLYNDSKRGVTPQQYFKSTIFPLYYNRLDSVNEIEDYYHSMRSPSDRDYSRLSGSEIVRYEDLNQYNIVTHVKNLPIPRHGIIKGNSYYQEDEWYIQIPSINIAQKNEATWKDGKPSIVLNWIPNDLDKTEISDEDLPNTYNLGNVDTTGWTYRQQIPIKDKYIKIKIRYTGNDLAIITGILTTYRLSYV